jgi:hypothetical protein
MRRTFLVAAVLLSLTACSDPQPTPPPGVSCGSFELGQGETLTVEAANCLLDSAEAKRAATLTQTAPTIEGDPITTTFTARTDGRIDVATDSREDRYGADEITYDTCESASWVADQGLVMNDCKPKT